MVSKIGYRELTDAIVNAVENFWDGKLLTVDYEKAEVKFESQIEGANDYYLTRLDKPSGKVVTEIYKVRGRTAFYLPNFLEKFKE